MTSDRDQALAHVDRTEARPTRLHPRTAALLGPVPDDGRWHRKPGRRMVRASVFGQEWRKVGRLRWLLRWGGR